ncbi:hypothetical protein ABZ876_08470 [Streptomyces sp. NPDC046931]|uniref:hypothetical protein n=1 Tax=Streptomyces sp. NPDC046931 TaxID=3154806 RepID=UPI0033FD8E86
MTTEYTITDVGEDPHRDLWYVAYEDAAGERHTHVFPKSTLEWRAAEYGLTDPAEILDVILHEAHTPDPRPRRVMRSLTSPTAHVKAEVEPVTLYTATSTTQARTAHLDRIRATKTGRARIVNPPSDPLAVIRARHGITAEGVRAKRERVDVHRWNSLYGGLPVPVPSALEVPRA